MSSQDPGGGFTSVKGYNDPAGSQAEADRRLREDEARRVAAERERDQQEAAQRVDDQRRRDQEQLERDRARTSRSSSRRDDSGGDRGGDDERARKTRSSGSSSGTWSPTSAGQKVGLVAFLTVGGYAGYKAGGEYWWVASLAAGGLAAYIGARFYKHIAVLVVLLGGLWIWDRMKAPSNELSAYTSSPVVDAAYVPPNEIVNTAPPTPAPTPAPVAAPAAEDAGVTHVFNINNGLVPPADLVAAPASATPPAEKVYYADDMVFSYVGPPLFAAGDVLGVSHTLERFADTGGSLRATTIRHRNEIDYNGVERFGYHVPTGTLAAYTGNGYRAMGEFPADVVALDLPQQIVLQHESGRSSRGYTVVVFRE